MFSLLTGIVFIGIYLAYIGYYPILIHSAVVATKKCCPSLSQVGLGDMFKFSKQPPSAQQPAIADIYVPEFQLGDVQVVSFPTFQEINKIKCIF